MKDYIVTYAVSYTVKAENEEEALDKADDLMNEDFDSGWFSFDNWEVTEKSED